MFCVITYILGNESFQLVLSFLSYTDRYFWKNFNVIWLMNKKVNMLNMLLADRKIPFFRLIKFTYILTKIKENNSSTILWGTNVLRVFLCWLSLITYLICIKSILGIYFHVVFPSHNIAIRKFDWWQFMTLGYGPLPSELSSFQESDVGIIYSLGWFRIVSCSLDEWLRPLPTHKEIFHWGEEVLERGHCQQLQQDVGSSFWASYQQ